MVVLGGILSLPTMVAGVEANAHAVPMISNVATEEGIRRIGPFVFHQVPSRGTEARAAAELATFDLRSFRAAILSPQQGEGRDLATAFTEQFVALGGQVVASENYEAGTTDFNRMVRRIRNSSPDLLYLPIPVEDALLLAPALGFQGLDVPTLGTTHWQSERLLRLTGVDLEGALVPAGQPQDDLTVLDEFERLYQQRFGNETNRFAAAGFIAARRVLEVLSADPLAGRQQMQQRLASLFGGGFENNAPMPFLLVRDNALVGYPLQ
jgi:branched-chain amino acid transport system substrate-binding protein